MIIRQIRPTPRWSLGMFRDVKLHRDVRRNPSYVPRAGVTWARVGLISE